MKYKILLLAMGCALILAACATPAPTPPPAPTLASDAADCTNLPANGSKIKIASAWARGTESGMNASSAASNTGMGMGSSASTGMGTGMSMGIKTAAFMVIHNCAAQPDSLVKATSNLEGMTTLMSFEMKDGKSAMMDVSQIDIPAGKKVELKSGGYHIMFTNLKKDLKPDFPLEVTLIFKNAGEIKITLPVRIPQE